MNPNVNELAGYYAKRAPEYERIYHKPERQVDLQLLREFVSRTFAGRRVLEIACGTGWWTEVLAATAHSVVATDINEEVLAIARTKAIPHGRISFRLCDAFDLDQVEGEFDAALAAFWWSHLTRPQLTKFLAGLHGRLAPGSVVMFIDNVYVEGSSTPISRRDAEGNTYQWRRLDDGSATEVLKNFPTDEDIHAALAGHTDPCSIQRLPHYWLARYTIRDPQAAIGHSRSTPAA